MNESLKTAHRLIERDTYLRASGRVVGWNTLRSILEFVTEHKLLGDPTIQQWIGTIAQNADWWFSYRLFDTIGALVDAGDQRAAHSLFRLLTGLESSRRWTDVAEGITGDNSPVLSKVEPLLKSPGLLSTNAGSWGASVITLFGRAMIEEQRRSASHKSAPRRGKAPKKGDEIEPDYDDYPQGWFYSFRDMHTARHIFTRGIDRGLRECLGLPEPIAFQELASKLIAERFAIGFSLLLLSLYDRLREGSQVQWHVQQGISLLSTEGVQSCSSIADMRRLLRQQLLPLIDKRTAESLVNIVRQYESNDYARAAEFADFEKFGVLQSEDMAHLKTIEGQYGIYDPSDPREKPTIRTEWKRPDPEWSHPEDLGTIEELTHAANDSDEDSGTDMPAKLESHLTSIRTILSRPDAKTERWRGECLGWCRRLLARIKSAEQRRQDVKSLSADAWSKALDAHAPWWKEWMEIALACLAGPVPKHHRKDRSRSHLSWGSNDRMMQSLSYCDEVLAIEGEDGFARYREMVGDAINKAWVRWPSFTRATALSCLRSWYWHILPELNNLLVRAASEEDSPLVLHYVVERLLDVRPASFNACMESLLTRLSKLPDASESLDLVSQVIGASVVYSRTDGGSTGDAGAVAELFTRIRAEGASEVVMRGLIAGANEELKHTTTLNEAHASAWSELAKWVFATWTHLDEKDSDFERFPTHVIMHAFDFPWTKEAGSKLYSDMHESFVQFLKRASLPEFAAFHHELGELFGSRRQKNKPSRAEMRYRISDNQLIELCRSSADRVLSWHASKKKTNDLGWVGSLRGEDTAMLVRTAIACVEDRRFLRCELPPILDKLFEAGCTETATELRILLRDS